MPSLITHNIFANKEYTRCGEKCTFLKNNLLVFNLGNQGVEPFSFSDYLFDFSPDFNFAKEKIEKRIKREDSVSFILTLEKVAFSYKEEEKRSICYSFFLGVLLNYILERKTQPFIYYRSGFRSDGTLSNIDIQNHRRYETMVDYFNLEISNVSKSKDKQYHCLDVEKEKLLIISEYIYEVILSMYPESKIKKNTYLDCVEAYRHYLKTINHGVSRKVLFGLGLKYTDLGSDIFPRKLINSDRKDFLNLSKEKWYNPITFEEANDSYVELMDQCLVEGEKVFSYCMDSFKNKNVTNKLNKLCSNINFEGFIPGKKMMYQKSIFTKGDK